MDISNNKHIKHISKSDEDEKKFVKLMKMSPRPRKTVDVISPRRTVFFCEKKKKLIKGEKHTRNQFNIKWKSSNSYGFFQRNLSLRGRMSFSVFRISIKKRKPKAVRRKKTREVARVSGSLAYDKDDEKKYC